MGYLRFRRTLGFIPGVRFNLSKSGVSVSLGSRGLKYTIGPNGERVTVGLPGTGVSYTQYQKYRRGEKFFGWFVIILIILLAAVFLLTAGPALADNSVLSPDMLGDSRPHPSVKIGFVFAVAVLAIGFAAIKLNNATLPQIHKMVP